MHEPLIRGSSIGPDIAAHNATVLPQSHQKAVLNSNSFGAGSCVGQIEPTQGFELHKGIGAHGGRVLTGQTLRVAHVVEDAVGIFTADEVLAFSSWLPDENHHGRNPSS